MYIKLIFFTNVDETKDESTKKFFQLTVTTRNVH